MGLDLTENEMSAYNDTPPLRTRTSLISCSYITSLVSLVVGLAPYPPSNFHVTSQTKRQKQRRMNKISKCESQGEKREKIRKGRKYGEDEQQNENCQKFIKQTA